MDNPQNEAEQGTYLDLAVHAVLAYAIYRERDQRLRWRTRSH